MATLGSARLVTLARTRRLTPALATAAALARAPVAQSRWLSGGARASVRHTRSGSRCASILLHYSRPGGPAA